MESLTSCIIEKLARRKKQLAKHIEQLREEFNGGDETKLLCRECMSDEESEGENRLVVRRPSWRSEEVSCSELPKRDF